MHATKVSVVTLPSPSPLGDRFGHLIDGGRGRKFKIASVTSRASAIIVVVRTIFYTMKITFNWEKFVKSLELPCIQEHQSMFGFFGIRISKSETMICIEFFKTKTFYVHIGQWEEIFCF